MDNDVEELRATAALTDEELRRIRMAECCHDCDSIEKVVGAGEVFDGPSGRFQLMHNGVKVAEHCYDGPWMTELIHRMRGHHEPQEERVFHEVMKLVSPGSTMVELGCYWSYYSLWFNQVVEGASLLLLEPMPENLEAGRRNFALNAARGEFVHGLIGARSETNSRIRGEDRIVRIVPTYSVDDLTSEHGVECVELLLIDVQGAELDALRGAVELIRRGSLRFVFVSTHHHQISSEPLMHQRCIRFLEEHGAHVIARHNVIESFSGDGLVVASFDPRDRDLPEVELTRNWPTNSIWRELEFDLDAAWHSNLIGVAARKNAIASLASAAYRVPGTLPIVDWTRQQISAGPILRRLGRRD